MKYVVCKVESGDGKIWYKIRKKGWIFDSWLTVIDFTAYGMAYNKPLMFSSESEARRYIHDFLLSQKKDKVTELL